MENGPDPAAAPGDLVAVYGTLRRGGRLHHVLGTAAGRAVLAGTGTVEGELYEVSPAFHQADVDTSYPCLHPGAGRVVVEVYEVRDRALWDDLDELEGFDPHDLEGSEYHRCRVPVLDVRPPALAPCEAWTYVYVRTAPDPSRRIADGDWIAHAAGAHASPGSASSNL